MEEYISVSPLQRFHWFGDEWRISKGIWIGRNSDHPFYDSFKQYLSAEDLKTIKQAKYCLFVEGNRDTEAFDSIVPNLFLFALWLTKPTMTYIGYWFKKERVSGLNHAWSRKLDTYHYIEGKAEKLISDQDMNAASGFLKPLNRIYRTKGPLRKALVFTHYANTTIRWQLAFVMYVSAIEAMFRLDERIGFTLAFCSKCACFLENTKSRRDSLYKRLAKLYDTRSEILHGKYRPELDDDSVKNLAGLWDLVTISRKCWKKILRDLNLERILNSDFQTRKIYLNRLRRGYQPPKI